MSNHEPVVRPMEASRHEATVRFDSKSIVRAVARGFSVAIPVILAWTAACSESTGPPKTGGGDLPNIPGLTVSGPVVGAASAVRALAGTMSAEETVVYVALAPGSVPAGRHATIRDMASGQSVAPDVVNGGFDPVAIPASVGDTLLVEVKGTAAFESQAMHVVSLRRPIAIVRTDPPPRKRDVPLNALIIIVFSEPIDPSTVSTATVTLLRGTTPVPGTLRFADVARLRVEFRPDALLDPETDYQLVLSQAIRGANGGALDAAVAVPFTTGSVSPPNNLVFAAVSPGYLHTCGLTTAGAAYCWGANGDGELGNGDAPFSRSSPVLVEGGVTFASVTSGAFHSCGRTVAGVTYCWGANADAGQLGDGTTTNRSRPVLVAGDVRFTTVSAGGFHTCGVTALGAAFCWGLNNAGQLGDGSTTNRSAPVPVTGGLRFTAVSAGLTHTCGVTVSGAAYCWGANGASGSGDGRLGDGTTTDRSSPVPVAGGVSFATVSAGGAHSCGVTAAGDAYCWGLNESGALGDGTTTNRASPVLVAGGLRFTAVSAGHQHTCGASITGDAYCWGHGDKELGNPGRSSEGTPQIVTGNLGFVSVSAGTFYTCGVTIAGTAYCWGANWAFQLGDGSSTPSAVPIKVAGQRITEISEFQRVEVTTVTTGVQLDPDGYAVENDPWDYDEGAGMLQPVPANGTATIYLTPGPHFVGLAGVAENCDGENIHGLSIIVQRGVVTKLLYEVVCKDPRAVSTVPSRRPPPRPSVP